MTKNHVFCYLWGSVMIGLNFEVIVLAVILGWIYLLLSISYILYQ